jgi:hypothetical protein
MAGTGIQTAALAMSTTVEEYDGTNWTVGGSLNTSRSLGASSGIQTDALLIGGYTTTAVGNTESYNGTSWTEVNDLATARYALGGDGTSTATFAAGGATPTTGATEEWNVPITNSTLTAS